VVGSPSLKDVLPDSAGMHHAFGRASRTFDRASVVHDEARDRLLERLDFMRLDAQRVLDLGCATGRGTIALRERYPHAQVIAVDSHPAMLTAARQRVADVLGADACRLPLAGGSVDVMFANLLLPWCDPASLFAEAARTLREGGVFAFSSFGPDTLAELRTAWAKVDDQIHVHAFVDMHDLGDLAVRAGLAEPVMNVERLQVTYRDLRSLVEDLRACGAINVAGGRRRTLTGRSRWAAFERHVLARRSEGRFAVTVELIFGHAWSRGTRDTAGGARGRNTGTEAVIAAEQIPVRRRRGPPDSN
jgi:malonyl-CoA O-methyltransferase